MFILTDKDVYHPGETLKGHVYFHNFIPSQSKKLMIKLEGRETVPNSIFDRMREEGSNGAVVDTYKKQLA